MDFPESMSTAALHDLMETAEPETKYKSAEVMYAGYTEDELVKLAADTKDEIYAKCKDPMVHKILALMILSNMGHYHDAVATALAKEGKTEDAVGWATDRGILQSAHQLLQSVSFGENDFTLCAN